MRQNHSEAAFAKTSKKLWFQENEVFICMALKYYGFVILYF
jgi:hypothetical protein